MPISLSAEQQGAIQYAIEAGLVGSVDEFISSALSLLLREEASFDDGRAKQAGIRIRELRKGVRLNLQTMPLRELAHLEHRY